MAAEDGSIEFVLIRSAARRRTIAMQVKPGPVVVVRSPARMALRDVDAFVASRAGWVARQLARPQASRPSGDALRDGAELPFRGGTLRLQVTIGGRRATVEQGEDGTLDVHVPAAAAGDRAVLERAVAAWLAGEARRCLDEALARFGPAVGAEPRKWATGAARRRWGSCSTNGSLRVSWRAVMLEPRLFDYIVVHELCHLLEHNHSARFWAHVGRVLPDHHEPRAALRLAERTLTQIP